MTKEAGSSVGLPPPTGPCSVGRAVYQWNGDRELVVWIWYPAEPTPDARRATYLPAGWEAVGAFLGFDAGEVTSHAVEDAPVASGSQRFPVLVFSPAGLPPLVLAAIVEEVASHGYVVAGINHTHESAVTVFADGRVVPMDTELMRPVLGPLTGSPEDAFRRRSDIASGKAADMRFVVDRLAELADRPVGSDRLAGRLDLSRGGSFGHSLGGNAALVHCQLDPRCLAAANLDGAMWGEVGRAAAERPALLVLADHRELQQPCQDQVDAGVYPSVDWCEAERSLMRDGWQTVYASGRPGYCAVIAGTGHASFLDLPFLPIAAQSRAAGGLAAVEADPQRAWRLTCDCLLAFFERHVRGNDAPDPDEVLASSPQIRFGAPKDLLP